MTVVLVVLDGFGLNDDPSRNALLSASMWNWNRMLAEWPHARLEASGEAVGLPAGQMGNSEVGHLNLGAGFRVLQDLPRISAAIGDGSFSDNPALNAACERALARGGRLHLMGLVGPGGVHAVDEHLVAMVELAARGGMPTDRIRFHAFTDGRDTPPRSADRFVPDLEARFDGRATVASVTGRYWAMDRDRRWDRTKRAYDAIVHSVGLQAPSATAAIADGYARGEGDEFIQPTLVGEVVPLTPDDAVVHLNFRADRARQLTHALAQPSFDRFDRGDAEALDVTTLTEYQAVDELPVAVAFAPLVIDSLAGHLSRLGKRQLHVAETEKYAHVTYFFNGGREAEWEGEERSLVPSPRDVPTYDHKPEMSARDAAAAFAGRWRENGYRFGIINFANPDMVGHTGVIPAAVEAVEAVDACLGQVVAAVEATGGACIVTADHGNCDHMLEPDGSPNTAHSLNPVPLIVTAEGLALRNGGILADVAPTALELLGIAQPDAMTGNSLIQT